MRGRAKLVQSLHAKLNTHHAGTGQHSERVAQNAHAVARALGMPEHRARAIYASALLHDLGKRDVSRMTLNGARDIPRPDRLALRAHPAAGLKQVRARFPAGPLGRVIGEGVASHHERWDGQGYPSRLAGTAIPVPARIIAVVDAYDAMTTARGYNTPKTHDQAVTELRASAGSHFDPAVVEAFAQRPAPAPR